ncbi:MAG: SO_0444 family Cu/Zn efflux transporter [Sulfuricurvum sp.]|uniref:SO_0444 family Cu/Zn efflux transporter n=1 Tax=Sulfuricurvum sp. TaxID=2025608 RepID=UPI00260AF4E5|nr:SO_0444 family Cu/Zn efflux transporter [Sulfuricurvum sp.]MDD2368870.1 SO_0444 family Cu/Zn efflux transporter [Sulfuricurvum sp.]MDD5118363.1 SO_0444 family Cu/Zn efflux transporter [Sulfuricurvum sp.]
MEALASSFWNLSASMGIFIVVGVLIAGILHELVPEDLITKQLGTRGWKSVFKGTLFGIPLPLCSCSVIPFAAELKRKGASEGAVLSFLISTPITGVDSILATYGMFGWAFTFYRVITSSIIAIIAGSLANVMIKPHVPTVAKFSLNPQSSQPLFVNKPVNETARVHSFSIRRALHYGFVSLLGGIASPLLWGLVIGAFISMMIPGNLSHYFTDSRWMGYLIAVAIAAPMYVCATASLPIAASLILAGVSPGAAFVFLSAGPATNTVTMGVVKSMLGTKALIIYLGSIIIGSVGFGIVFDLFFDATAIGGMLSHQEAHGWVENFGAGALLILIAYNLIQARLNKKNKSCSGGSCCS